ncbi:MAG: RND family efflux transporter MFP subunit [Parcubacteria group bacterium GW2011_GWA2_47_16]|nr:MAG: RND family efflux transporter MFP subunit [Parcubacteria group bacterium GW2011_GWA2_47_16]
MGAVVIVLGLFFYATRDKIEPVSFAKVKLGTVSEEVTVTGTVKSKEAVVLAFEKTGKVRKINIEVGDKVERGNLLVALENEVEISLVEDAEAKLASKQAHYEDLRAGGSLEEINLKESGLAKAIADLAADYDTVINVLLDAFNKADNAVRRQADSLFSNSSSASPKLNFTAGNQQYKTDAENERFNAEGALNSFKKLVQGDFETRTDSENALVEAKKYLLSINDFLFKINRALDTSINLSDTVLTAGKDALNTARTNVNTAITNTTDTAQAITIQKVTVETARNDLKLTQAGATPEVLVGALADIQSAAASVKNARAVLAKTYITSPISGIVTKQDAKVGEIVGANAPIIAVASDNFKIEAFVPEVDVAKISVGNEANVTLDAYGSDVYFNARIIKIDPAETTLDGVPTYKTTLEFEKNDERIRSGLTANITLTTAKRENALSVPTRAVFEMDGKKFVRVLKNGEEREVVVGLKGSTGEIEVISGLMEGESVLTSVKTK